MNPILNSFLDPSNQTMGIVLLSLAAFRLYLEIIDFKFENLPLTKVLARSNGAERLNRFHRMGLYFSMGYILFFAPGYLLS
jgi:hypothetical protein